MTNELFSEKQKFMLKWWNDSLYMHKDGIICDGAVRSGKTTAMSVGFSIWAMCCFNGENFGICGKTIVSLRRNLLSNMLSILKKMGCTVKENASKNYLDIAFAQNKNRFYLFGGKDESSASLIQGVTLAGILMDETVLMPQSFVEQAVARCSVNGSKLWFNCNPEGPYHWFKKEWIDRAQEKNLLYVHFDLEDNPSLSRQVRERYARLFSGVFYERFILGKWAVAEGIVYPMFDSEKHVYDGEIQCEKFIVSCDYGTVNPSSFGLWGECGNKWYRIDEYYFDSAVKGVRRTDEEHYLALCQLIGNRCIQYIVCDPSAASFIQCIRSHGKYRVKTAKNDVVWGIRKVSDFIREDKMRINRCCRDTLREFALYRWDENSGKDRPLKENDHAMDDIRYFVTSLEKSEDAFAVFSLDRREGL